MVSVQLKKLLFVVAILLSFKLWSVEVTGLYQYNVIVENKTISQKQSASKNALLGVLKKVSGQQIDNAHEEVQTALNESVHYVLKYEYVESTSGLMLNVIFQQKKVDALIKQLDLPVWGNRRPLTLIWLAVEENYQRELVTKDTYPQLKQLVEINADNHGLPIITPLLDLEDMLAVSVTDVWANFPAPIIAASARYTPEKIISARLFQPAQSHYWQLDWQFTDENEYQLNTLTGDKQVIVGQMVENISEVLANEYAVNTLNDNHVEATRLQLIDIKNLKQLTLATRSISSIVGVEQLDIEYISDQRVSLKLTLSGTQESFLKSLNFDKNFSKVFDPLAFEQSPELEYRWLGK